MDRFLEKHNLYKLTWGEREYRNIWIVLQLFSSLIIIICSLKPSYQNLELENFICWIVPNV